MCGIFGVWQLNEAPINLQTVKRTTTALQHRGPDDEGYLLVNTRQNHFVPSGGASTDPALKLPPLKNYYGQRFNLVFSFRRLAILDLSPAGHQPMASANGKYWIVYNGEIYNYLELRTELRQLGYQFNTGTDTEVILAAYEAWGTNCLSRFNGMFAFALWDSHRQSLFCARDRFGIKPFYYCFNNKTFVFASEIKAFVEAGLFELKPNAAIIYDYLIARVIDHSSETFFDPILRLPPAHYLILEADGNLNIKRWWDLSLASDLSLSYNQQEQVEQFLELLRDSIRLRLRSDVPIGTCLSGGLDSSTIVCLANELMFNQNNVSHSIVVGERQKTFSIYFDDKGLDERKYIQAVVAKTHVAAHYISPRYEQLWQEMDRFIWHHDEPLASTSMYAQWNVMRLIAQNGVTVVLDGQGADEILAGYPPYLALMVTEKIQSLQWLQAVGRAREEGQITGTNWLNILGRGAFIAMPFWLQLGLRQISNSSNRQQINSVFQSHFARQWQDRNKALQTDIRRLARSIPERLYYDLMIFSLPQLLRYEDRNSMAFSIEGRVPFLDYRLVEFVFSINSGLKIKDGWTKWIMRQATENILPEEVRWRRDKMGFLTPEVKWLQQSRDKLRLLFSDSETMSNEFVNPHIFIDKLDNLLTAGGTTTSVWRVVNLELWLRRFWGNNSGGCNA